MVDVSALNESDKALVYSLVRRLREGPFADGMLHEDILYEADGNAAKWQRRGLKAV